MSKARLIERLAWYYPLERFHTYITVPATIVYLIYNHPTNNLFFLIYGLLVCIAILYQGQLYWKLKLERLRGETIDQDKNIHFFKKAKRVNVVLISLMLIAFLVQLYIQGWNLESNEMLYWGILANVFAVLEHINYYHIQLMIDNKYDMVYVLKNKRLKKASLAKDLAENRI